MVCAICGRMPLMMHSAPISRAAVMVLSRCWATSVSTVGTPVMSMIAYFGVGCDDRLQQLFHHDLGARAVQGADQRQRQNAVPQLHHRSGELQHLLLLARDHLLFSGKVFVVVSRASLSKRVVAAHISSNCASGSFANCAGTTEKIGCFRDRTKVAVSDEVNPCLAREAAMSRSISRVAAHSGQKRR